MSVKGFSSELLNTKLSAAVLLVFSLGLTGCGANGELINPFEQASVSDQSDDESETSDVVNVEDNSNTTADTSSNDTVEEQRVLNLVSQPSSSTISDGEIITFSLNVEHSHPITVTWFKDSTVVQSSSSTSFTASEAGTYNCHISDGDLVENCASFDLQVDEVQYLSIGRQPVNKVATEGDNVSISTNASSDGEVSYQWYLDNSPISGATSRFLTLRDVTEADAGSYKCVATSGSLSATTNTVSLVVYPQAPSVAITWEAPTKREDGSNLSSSDIAAYEIHYSATAGGELTLIDTVPASGANEFTMSGMSQGIHYFALATVDSNNVKSELSSAIAVNVD